MKIRCVWDGCARYVCKDIKEVDDIIEEDDGNGQVIKRVGRFEFKSSNLPLSADSLTSYTYSDHAQV